MFGYILPLKNEMKVYEYEYFRSYYHGLCYSLKNNFGNIQRLTLSYDLTFISFLIDAFYDEEIKLVKRRCIKHPTYDILVAENTKALDYISNLSILFFNYKLIDNIEDDNSFNSKVFYFFLKPSNKNIFNECENVKAIINKNLNELKILEKNSEFSSLDQIAHLFSDIMGKILKEYPYKFHNDSCKLREDLYLVGYNIGKYIYIMDAFDDLKEDFKNNTFNPLNVLYNKENKLDSKTLLLNVTPEIEMIIFNSISNIIDILKNMPIKKHKGILDNVISLGMTNKYYEILNKNIPPNL